jgi:GTPase SAR1 family protein
MGNWWSKKKPQIIKNVDIIVLGDNVQKENLLVVRAGLWSSASTSDKEGHKSFLKSFRRHGNLFSCASFLDRPEQIYYIRDDTRINIKLYNSAGYQKYNPTETSESFGFILVYDINNKKTFETLEKVHIPHILDQYSNYKVLLVGTDRNSRLNNEIREVSIEQAKYMAKKFGFKFYEFVPPRLDTPNIISDLVDLIINNNEMEEDDGVSDIPIIEK